MEEPRGKKKKKTRNRKGEKIEIGDRSWWLQTIMRNPGLGLAHLGRPRPRATQAWGSRLGCRSLGLPGSPRPQSFSPSDLSLPLIWVFRIGIDVFGISWICFWVFRPVHETSNFFKFFGVRNRVLEIRFQVDAMWKKIPHQTWSIHENRVPKTRFIGPKSSLKDSRC